MTTQTSAPMDVTIEDENGAQFFHGSRTGTDPLPVISGTFTSLTGKADDGLIMLEYVYVAEDWTDADYNDLYLSIVG